MQRIAVSMAPGERDREQDLRIVLSHDERFEPLKIDSEIPVDLQFKIVENIGFYKILNIELKEPNDFVQSVLNGHLAEQTMSIREDANDGCTVILGDQAEIYAALKDASKLRSGKYLRSDELRQTVAGNHLRCKSFRKRSFLNGVPVFWKGDDSGFFDGEDQWKDILELAHDYLLDGSMMGFMQRPAIGERELVATSMLFRGIGAKTLEPVMAEYRLALVPKGEYAKQPLDIAGIGPKRAKLIEERIVMHYGR
jgi:hypothetical protein